MNNIKSYKLFLFLLLFLLIPKYTHSENYGFFVDGGFSPGKKDTDMDKLVDKRIDDAMDIMKKKDPESDRRRFEKREDLVNALKNLKCKCGDVLTLYMVGHGSSSPKDGAKAFEFVKEDNEISPSDLLGYLKKAAVECCCKIHVVIFSCHSGAFFEKLFEESHVMSVYTSSKENELSYSDAYYENGKFFDGGDWIKGFNEDWEKDTNVTDWGKGLRISSESAKEKMPDAFSPKQHPQGWSKGESKVLAHVERRWRDPKTKKIIKLELHFYNPDFLRSKTYTIKTDSVNVPDSVDNCKWVTLNIITEGPKDKLKAVSDVTVVETPTEKILGHIEQGSTPKALKVFIISPKWLYGKIITIPVEPPGFIDPKLKFCNWIEADVKIKDPGSEKYGFYSTDSIRAKDQIFKCAVHVSDIDREKKTFNFHILEPPWLKCQNKFVRVAGNKMDMLNGVEKCTKLILNITFHPDGSETISNINKLTNSEGKTRFSLDAALQKPFPVVINDSSSTYMPSIGVTNVGSASISFPVYVVICKLGEKNLIDNWWRTGEGIPQGVWFSLKQINNLEAAQTISIDFDEYQFSSGNDIYWVGFKTALQGDENPSSDTSSIIFEYNNPSNHIPIVEEGTVTPDSGIASTQFTYSIIYYDEDNDPPAVHDVLIDSIPHSLVPLGNNFIEGVEFNYQTSLPEGPHNFSFRFDDGHSHTVYSGPFPGPLVTSQPGNHPPVLSGSMVQPDSGYSNNVFMFRVIYQDIDGDPPVQYQVFIDNNPFNMNPTGNNFTEGVVFVFQHNLPQGLYNYFFRFDDGHGHIVNTPNFTGPIVR